MATCNKVRVPAIGLAFLGFLFLFPLRGECQAASPSKVQACRQEWDAWEQALKAHTQAEDEVTHESEQFTEQSSSLAKTQNLAEILGFWKSYLVNYLNSVKEEHNLNLSAEQQKDYDSVVKGLADMTVLQVRVAARVSALQKSVIELTARRKTAEQAWDAAGVKFDAATHAYINCLDDAQRPPAPSVQPGAGGRLPPSPSSGSGASGSQNWNGTWIDGPSVNQISGVGNSISVRWTYKGDGYSGTGSWSNCVVKGNTATCDWEVQHKDDTKHGTRTGTLEVTLSGNTITGEYHEKKPQWTYEPGRNEGNVNSSMYDKAVHPINLKRQN